MAAQHESAVKEASACGVDRRLKSCDSNRYSLEFNCQIQS
jgi:hypothetical protein